MMNKIVELADKLIPFNFLPPDKKAHFLVGLLIGLIGSFLFTAYIAFFLGVIAALGKELYDERDYGGFDLYDLTITVIGTITGLFLYWIYTII